MAHFPGAEWRSLRRRRNKEFVAILKGGAFLGRRLVDRLKAEGVKVRVAVRRPDQARFDLQSIGVGVR